MKKKLLGTIFFIEIEKREFFYGSNRKSKKFARTTSFTIK